MGVSASHLDWTMVPYVRKSFNKHLKDGFEYVWGGNPIDDSFFDTVYSINDERLKSYPKVYQYAYDMTIKETSQAVEGMYHNLKY